MVAVEENSSEGLWLFFYYFGHALGMQKFLGQGLNPHHSSDLSQCSDNTGSLTHWATRKLWEGLFFKAKTLMGLGGWSNKDVDRQFLPSFQHVPSHIKRSCLITHPIESGLPLLTCLINKMWWQWRFGTSKARSQEALQLSMDFLECLLWGKSPAM